MYITIIDLKMRRQHQFRRFDLKRRPTSLFQIDGGNILIGTEGGLIEHRAFCQTEPIKVYEAHPESDNGISTIIELKTRSPLLIGQVTDPSARLIATASEGAPQFRVWRLPSVKLELQPYLKIETTFTGGIKYLLETHDTQLVAADESSIKFYDFIDKSEKDNQQKENKEKEEQQKQMKKMFADLDTEGTLKLPKDKVRTFVRNLSNSFKSELYTRAS